MALPEIRRRREPGIWPLLLLQAVFAAAPLLADAALDEARLAVRTQDFNRAFELYQQAAQAGDSEAQFQLANLYKLGKGTQANPRLVRQWLEASAGQQHPGALYTLSLLTMDEPDSDAAALMDEAVSLGYAPAIRYRAANTSKGQANTAAGIIDSQMWFAGARSNRLDLMEQFIPTNPQLNRQDEQGRTALIIAVEFGSIEVLTWLLGKGADLNIRDNFGNSAAFEAVTTNNNEALSLLLPAGVDMQQLLPNGDNLLHYSIRHENYEAIPALIAAGIPLNSSNVAGWTPLDLAANADAHTVVQLLENAQATHSDKWLKLSQGSTVAANAGRINLLEETDTLSARELTRRIFSASTSQIENWLQSAPTSLHQVLDDGSTLLALAVKQQRADLIQLLLQAGADVNQSVFGGATPLELACSLDDTDITGILLAAGANPLLKNSRGQDAIEISIQNNHDKQAAFLLDSLLSNQAPVQIQDLSPYLLLSARHDRHALAVQLLDHANPSRMDETGRSAYWYAASNANSALLRLMLTHNDIVIAADNEGKSPLFTSVEHGCLECAQLLLPHENVNSKAGSGNTPLMLAAKNGDEAMVRWLLDNKADAEARNNLGNTALLAAVETGNVAVITLLLDAGALPARKNNMGISALDIANEMHPELLPMLRKQSLLGLF